ncbi:YojF family protein [Sutcliffiella horikoshii]|uniref:YojF family protein n=1 Tax=Sutcliffiella horikoshii TaxID=79883 RepID=UPI00203E8529|nr:YojF family protein [Sutcliffiella horikoshii]MCM3617194.1 YojF family protein [Sutcliffiella horikoshii]
MKLIDQNQVQAKLNKLIDAKVFLHLETTNGAYAGHHNTGLAVGAFIRNVPLKFERAKIVGKGPYRVGLKLEHGWVYAEGVTHFEIDEKERLLLAGLNPEGKLAVALQISQEPF